MDPYRTNSPNSNKEFGLIIAPKPQPRHRCSYPNSWSHLWRLLFGKTIEKRSLWRCSCGVVYIYGGWNWGWNPTQDMRKSWEEMGGYIPPQYRIENPDFDDEVDDDEADDDEDDLWGEESDDDEDELEA